jgi:hypothetical protein
LDYWVDGGAWLVRAPIAPTGGDDGYLDQILTSPWFHWIGGALVGFAAGVWIDVLLKRQTADTSAKEIDKEALAAEAEALAGGISSLVGDYAGRAQIAWHQDAADFRVNMPRRPMMENKAKIEAAALEKYGEKYHKDVWRIISLARKCTPLDYNLIWLVEHGIRFTNIEQLPSILTKIAVDLRHPQSDIPMIRTLPAGIATSPRTAPPASPPQPAPPE